MGHRQQQHMGRSEGDERELVGRDVQAGDPTAERASRNVVPMPNEEGTDFRADRPADDDVGAVPPGPDAERNRDLRDGGSGAREGGS